jgi:hypothetical protein
MAIENNFKTYNYLGSDFVSAKEVNQVYKTICRRSTPKKLIRDLGLGEIIIIWSNPPTDTFIKRLLNLFKSNNEYYIDLNELMRPNKGPNKKKHMELLRLIELMPDL